MTIKILCLILVSVFQIGSVNEETQKQINTNISRWDKNKRSLSTHPILSHSNSTIFIYSNYLLENLDVTITDSAGQIVYMDGLRVEAGNTVSFNFNPSMESEYLIEVWHEGKYLYGWFGLEL
ncbi:DUF3244 domain-containing protein [Bacteroides sp. 519]|uniref:DUF3244 domain-containing protein n=1 Tax=Bacteroides sp. 519 TaxID=2302937 RepID=UPI0013D388D5|nr:DUF3244 domain-containing protein [Bacteroides sp. 519]NDV57507.1 DUF3244 domain-containing protein [Bacteroides sp. 519]